MLGGMCPHVSCHATSQPFSGTHATYSMERCTDPQTVPYREDGNQDGPPAPSAWRFCICRLTLSTVCSVFRRGSRVEVLSASTDLSAPSRVRCIARSGFQLVHTVDSHPIRRSLCVSVFRYVRVLVTEAGVAGCRQQGRICLIVSLTNL